MHTADDFILLLLPSPGDGKRRRWGQQGQPPPVQRGGHRKSYAGAVKTPTINPKTLVDIKPLADAKRSINTMNSTDAKWSKDARRVACARRWANTTRPVSSAQPVVAAETGDAKRPMDTAGPVEAVRPTDAAETGDAAVHAEEKEEYCFWSFDGQGNQEGASFRPFSLLKIKLTYYNKICFVDNIEVWLM